VWVRGALRSSKTRRDSIRGPLRVRQEHWMFPNKGPKDIRGTPKRVLKHFCKIKLICSFFCVGYRPVMLFCSFVCRLMLFCSLECRIKLICALD
jgi:hypothetical protein